MNADFETVYCKECNRATNVTAAISLFNYENFICETLSSLLQQTKKHFDLIIVDDCSTDDSLQKAKKWMHENSGRFSRCLLIRHKENFGLPISRNSAFQNSHTSYVFVLDADNLLYPRCLDRLSEALDESDAAFSYSILKRFDAEEELHGYLTWNKDLLARGNYIDAMAMIRKSAWDKVGGYSRMQVTGWEDYEFWCKLAEEGEYGVLVPEILARYRVHMDSMINAITNKTKNMKIIEDEISYLHPWLKIQ